MKIFRSLTETPADFGPSALTIGNFDGVHYGHRRIFRRMGDLHERGEHIDRITVANELMKFNELESCDGLSYLVSLDDGLPQIPNVDSYVKLRMAEWNDYMRHLTEWERERTLDV